jgi:hypothetical protein
MLMGYSHEIQRFIYGRIDNGWYPSVIGPANGAVKRSTMYVDVVTDTMAPIKGMSLLSGFVLYQNYSHPMIVNLGTSSERVFDELIDSGAVSGASSNFTRVTRSIKEIDYSYMADDILSQDKLTELQNTSHQLDEVAHQFAETARLLSQSETLATEAATNNATLVENCEAIQVLSNVSEVTWQTLAASRPTPVPSEERQSLAVFEWSNEEWDTLGIAWHVWDSAISWDGSAFGKWLISFGASMFFWYIVFGTTYVFAKIVLRPIFNWVRG